MDSADKYDSEMAYLIERSRKDIAKIEEMIKQKLAQGVFVDVTLFEGVKQEGHQTLPFYCADRETRETPGEKFRGIVILVDRDRNVAEGSKENRGHRYVRLELYKGAEKNMQVDVYGSAIHSYTIDTRDSYSQDVRERMQREEGLAENCS